MDGKDCLGVMWGQWVRQPGCQCHSPPRRETMRTRLSVCSLAFIWLSWCGLPAFSFTFFKFRMKLIKLRLKVKIGVLAFSAKHSYSNASQISQLSWVTLSKIRFQRSVRRDLSVFYAWKVNYSKTLSSRTSRKLKPKVSSLGQSRAISLPHCFTLESMFAQS